LEDYFLEEMEDDKIQILDRKEEKEQQEQDS